MPIQPTQGVASSSNPDEESAADFNQMMDYEDSGYVVSSELSQSDKIVHSDFFNRFGDLCDDDNFFSDTTTALVGKK